MRWCINLHMVIVTVHQTRPEEPVASQPSANGIRKIIEKDEEDLEAFFQTAKQQLNAT